VSSEVRPAQHALVTAGLTTLTMVAFASNSLLCRGALARPEIDPASFATVRTVAGALTLWLLHTALPHRRSSGSRGNWLSALALAVYMTGFAYAYVSLDAGTGALILFGAVQITMMAAALVAGERLRALQWLGFALAIGGLTWLMLPGVTKPPVTGAALMALAGVGWGVYSLRGRRVQDPLGTTAENFMRAAPLVACVSLLTLASAQLSGQGALLAIVSGALASGVGYSIWYAALAGLTAAQAASVQLTVPVIAALGGVALLGERLSGRLGIAALLTLGGVALAIGGRRMSIAQR
jgi:drug/metabolite transporter (DMT)-like permease